MSKAGIPAALAVATEKTREFAQQPTLGRVLEHVMGCMHRSWRHASVDGQQKAMENWLTPSVFLLDLYAYALILLMLVAHYPVQYLPFGMAMMSVKWLRRMAASSGPSSTTRQ